MSEENKTEVTPLQSQDLVVVLEALQLAAQRGAFRVEEFKTIGETYTRLYTFSVASGIIKPQQPTAPESTTGAKTEGN